MNARALRPWTELVRLHPDVESGTLTQAVFAIDLGAIAESEARPSPIGPHVRTMWGWLAWQLGGEQAYRIVAGHDADRVSPGGDVARALLTTGAGGRPVLLLLDEVLKYMERAAAVAVLDSTLQGQAKDFFQTLTVEVAGSQRGVRGPVARTGQR